MDRFLTLAEIRAALHGDPPKFNLGQKYTRADIRNKLGGREVGYLPTNNGRVVCGP